MIFQLKGNTARAIVEYHEALNNTDAGELINELLETALLTNYKTPYAAGNKDPSLNDAFDIFQMADSIRDTKDEVEKELAEGDWNESATAAGDRTRSNAGDQGNLATNDSLIIDEGDLRPNMSREWI
jgi:hypothetical protein